ncbi:MAG TPA: TraR/DksA C4-type zinc finger protein [Chthoniobacterales bacterium]|jgi:RNA polymerase-binding transcription factor DksA|nr:TraR/DksA C4-type zinc finger protein [Chthoniobacterales bacterium]
MASSANKKSSKTTAKSKTATKKAASSKPASKSAPAAKKTAAKPARKAAGTGKSPKANGARKDFGPENVARELLSTQNNKPQKRLDPFVRGQKEKLLNLRDAMVDSMAGVAKDNLRSRAEGSEASAFGMHQADAGSDAYDRDFALSLLSQEQDALYEIDQALKRIELGTYGVCEMSGKPISHARLEAIPFARFTVECQSQLEKQNKASRVRQSVTSLFGLTEEEGGENEEEEAKPDDSKE